MHVIIGGEFKRVGDEVVLHCRVHLDDISTLTTNVDIVDCACIEMAWSWTNGKCMCPGNVTEYQ